MTPYNPPNFGNIQDDERLFVSRQDMSGGINSKMHGAKIADNQATNLINVDIGVPGQRSKRPGSVLVTSYLSNGTIIGIHNYVIQGATDQLLAYAGTTLQAWAGSGAWSNYKTDFDASVTTVGFCNAKESGLSPDDVVLVGNRVDNVFRFSSDGTPQDLGNTNTSPPKTDVMTWYRNRVWALLNDLLYYSTAYPADYSAAFDRTSNAFRMPVGEEKALVATREMGIVAFGSEAVWALAPSATPDASTDKPEPLIPNMGAVSTNGVVEAGDDIYFFASDGLRALKRTIQDKLQTGTSYPLSFQLKDEFERINWAYASKIAMEYYDNKIFISVPTGVSSVDTWVYYPITQGFTVIQGWNARTWTTYRLNGQVNLYYGSI